MMEVMLDTKPLDCPEHLGRHKAVLYCWPHRFAGIWECPASGSSDGHEHEDLDIESVTEDHMGFDGHYQTERSVYVCAACGVTIDLDVADPELDRAEAIADMQADIWRDE